MSRAALLLPLAALALGACATPPPEPVEPEPVVRVDTVVVTREVAPPLPQGQAASLCIATGQNVQIRVSPAGDTLIGPQRVRLEDLGPGIGFVGDYAGGQRWFVGDDPVTFDDREFSKFGQPEARSCEGMRIVGDFDGVNLFAETTASSPLETLYVPVRPGIFQPYRADVGRVRG